jgi:hypothetical protein
MGGHSEGAIAGRFGEQLCAYDVAVREKEIDFGRVDVEPKA